MKMILIAATAALMNAQGSVNAKPAPDATKETAPVSITERLFTADEIEKLSLYSAQLQVIRDKHKADELEKSYREYQADIAPIAAKQRAIVEAACVQVGVPKEKIESGECGVTFGIGPDGKPVVGADGKPVDSKAWKIVPKQPADKK